MVQTTTYATAIDGLGRVKVVHLINDEDMIPDEISISIERDNGTSFALDMKDIALIHEAVRALEFLCGGTFQQIADEAMG